jgi:hypothetical protein
MSPQMRAAICGFRGRGRSPAAGGFAKAASRHHLAEFDRCRMNGDLLPGLPRAVRAMRAGSAALVNVAARPVLG